ncbi:hypothetical protein [Bacillus subtilis]
MGKRFLEKLESYEKEAYEGQCGIDWLTELGENERSIFVNVRELIQKLQLESLKSTLMKWLRNFCIINKTTILTGRGGCLI